ncbi:Family with sequence similarity 96, member A [Perkinsus olseni]|uniref:Family with sequence similarity 96, member A n=1 Tax=Perkinsus olseni TaxID=32597 RepID=A0A7J6NK83_PEROL|nr:Family with sequence similarity 96, member A [Perkinsus olseni]
MIYDVDGQQQQQHHPANNSVLTIERRQGDEESHEVLQEDEHQKNMNPYQPKVYIDDDLPLPSSMTGMEMDVWASIKNIKDPEYPLWTLSQLRVCYPTGVSVKGNTLIVEFTPTVEHCSLATLIGLCIRSKLVNDFGNSWKIIIHIKDGTHNDSQAISKQLNDKERCSAAMENPQLLELVQTATCDTEWAY